MTLASLIHFADAHAQSTFGCIVCHCVAFSNASATRSGDASSYKPPVNMIDCGRCCSGPWLRPGVSRKPQGRHTAGSPVRIVIGKLALLGAGETNASHGD